MIKDNILKICFSISIFFHIVFFASISLKDPNILTKQNKHSHPKEKEKATLIEIQRYNAPAEKLFEADILSLACVETSSDDKEGITPYIQSVWDNTYDDIIIKKAIPTQYNDKEDFVIVPEKRLKTINEKLKANTDIIKLKTKSAFTKTVKSIWISDPLINYRNTYLNLLGENKVTGLLLIDSKGMIKNILIEDNTGSISGDTVIKVIKQGFITSTEKIEPKWLKFEII